MTRTALWIIVFAIAFDVTINHFFTMPYGHKTGAQLANFFEYGRSVEGKIVRMISDNDTNAHNLAKAGWFKSREENPGLPAGRRTTRNVYVYGMSFSRHIGKILSQIDPGLNVKFFDGPGASLNHSYAYYELTRPHEKGDVVILGILASSLPLLTTMTHMTSHFESPSPHFYPRYRIDDSNKIVKDEIKIKSLSELRRIMSDTETWGETKQALARYDAFYDPIIFEKDFLDHSVYFRLVKRAWGQRVLALNYNRYHDLNGYKNEDGLIDLAQRLVSEFADRVRSDGAIPYLILFNDRGYDDHLYQVLKPILTGKDIPYYSTHRRFAATNLANFISDGHFKPVIDIEIAKEVHRQLTILLN